MDTGHRRSLRRRSHEETASSSASLPYQLEAGRGVLRTLDHDVLEQIAEACLDGTLVSGLDLEIVGNGALLVDLAVRLHEHRACRVAVAGARRVELFEGLEARVEAGELVLAGADGAGAPFVLDARAGELRFAGRPR